MSAESWSNSRVCAGLHSAPVRRSFDKEMGATRVVAVIFSFTFLSHQGRDSNPRGWRNPMPGLAGGELRGRPPGTSENFAPSPARWLMGAARDTEKTALA